jgi:hypothetical protein
MAGVMVALRQAAHAQVPNGPPERKVDVLINSLVTMKQEAHNETKELHKNWTIRTLRDMWSSTPAEIVSHLGPAPWKDGILVLPDTGLTPPWAGIQTLFDQLSECPNLVAELNALYPVCNIVKDAALDLRRSDTNIIDQKVAFGLNTQRLQALQQAPGLVEKLGAPFNVILEFFHKIEQVLISKLIEVLSTISGQDLAAVHIQHNNNFRIIDYPEHESTQGPARERRCGAHRDFGTFTIVFPAGEGLQVEKEGKFYDLPGDVPQLFFGYCGAILSNNRLHAAKHRVVDTIPGKNGNVARRNSLVFFVAPDENTPLKPAFMNGEKAQFKSGLTSTELKGNMKRKWKAREGTLGREAAGEAGSQDEIIDQFLRTPEAM